MWIHDEQTGKYVLRDGDGTVHARFDSAADIFTDASAYPTGGNRNVKPPIIPEYEMNGDLREVEWDVIVVPPETKTPMDIMLYQEGGSNIHLPNLIDDTADEKDPTTPTTASIEPNTPDDTPTQAEERQATDTREDVIDEAAEFL